MHAIADQQGRLEQQAAELEHQLDQSRRSANALQEANKALREEIDNRARAEWRAEVAQRARGVADSVLSFVLDSAPVAVAIHDRDGRFVRVNGAFAAIFNRTPEEFSGRTVEEMTGDAEQVTERLHQVLEKGESAIGLELSTGTGTTDERFWLGSIYPVRDARGELMGAGGIMVETTAQRRLERQYQQAQKLEAIGRLAGGVAHDFNNILTAITSYSELLLESLPREDDRRADVAEIRHAADRAAGLTRQLLVYSRHQVVQPRVVSLNGVLADLEKLLRRVLREDTLLRILPAPDLDAIHADPGQLEQVILNLCVNAGDAMPGGGTISISTCNVRVSGTTRYSPDGTAVPQGDYVMLRVADTGVGMAAETQAHIFEPFFTTKEPGRGTGLGLATVYGIVKRAQGHVLVQSELGRGSTFDILWPRISGPVERTLRPGPELTARSSRGEIILLVEDDPSVRDGVSRLLTRQGHTVVEARSGAEALRKAEAEGLEIDLVITDMVMPEMNGPELVRRLRGRSPGIRVLLMSGYSREMDDAPPAGPRDAYIEKPFSAAQLAEVLRRILGDASAPVARL